MTEIWEVIPFADKATFKMPVGLAADTAGNLFVADQGLHAIVKIQADGSVSVLAGGNGKGFKDGHGADAAFYRPVAVTCDTHGNVLVADSGNNRIRKVTPDGVVSTIAGSGQEGAQDGVGVAASFKCPQGLIVDSNGTIYVADTENDTIRKILPNGAVSTLAGHAGNRGKVDGVGAAASFDRPIGVWLDVQGTLYVADSQNNLIRTIDTETGAVAKWVGVGQRGHRDGAKFPTFAMPTFVVADSTGNLFVVDTDNHAIRRVDSAGAVHTVAGGKEGCASGFNACFKNPRALVLDPFTSTLIVADSGNAKLVKLRPTNEVTFFESMVQQAQAFKDSSIREVADIEAELQHAHKRKADAIVALAVAQRRLEEARARNRPLLAGSAPLLLK